MKQKPFNDYYFIFVEGKYKKHYIKSFTNKNNLIKTYKHMYKNQKVDVLG